MKTMNTELAATYQIEIANRIGMSNGRATTVGTDFVVTQRPIRKTTILATFRTRAEAVAWIEAKCSE